jgi:transcriptional regulator of arginine metabolism
MTQIARQELIRSLLRERAIHSQAELVECLRERGVVATQATVSRDLRRLGVLKSAAEEGRSHYLLPDQVTASPGGGASALARAFAGAVTGVAEGKALLLVKTLSGHANAVAAAIDQAHLDEIAGTVAGNDTILIVVHDLEAAKRLRRHFGQLLE